MEQTTTAEQPRTADQDQADAPSPRRSLADLARRPLGVAVAGVVLAAATFTGGLVVGRATAADPGTTGGTGPGAMRGQGPGGQGPGGQGQGGFGQGQQGQQQAPNQVPGQVPALPAQPQDDGSSDGSSTTSDPVAADV